MNKLDLGILDTANGQNVIIAPGNATMLIEDMQETVGYIFKKDIAEHIVRAVNAHEDLIAAAKDAIEMIGLLRARGYDLSMLGDHVIKTRGNLYNAIIKAEVSK